MIGEVLRNVLNKIDIRLEGASVIQNGLINGFIDFLCGSVGAEGFGRGIIMHTGSICFDAVLVVFSAIASILDSKIEIDDIISNLEKGDKVKYGKKIYVYEGREIVDGNERIVLTEQNGGRTSIGEKGWNKIVPYFGNARTTGGRGSRKSSQMRTEFFVDVLGYEESDVPGITDASAIMVMDRDMADYLAREITIGFGDGMEIPLLDLVTASYFTEGNEMRFGGNSAKNEPVLKFTSKLSVANSLVSGRNGNRCVGVCVCGNYVVSTGKDEIHRLMDRQKPKFIFVSTDIDCREAFELTERYEGYWLFACTKDFLLSGALSFYDHKNEFNRELIKQTNIIIDREIEEEVLECPIDGDAYRKFRNALLAVKRSDGISQQWKEKTVIPAYSLMNVFMTLPASVKCLEQNAENEKYIISSPDKVINEIRKNLEKLPDSFSGLRDDIVSPLETMYLGNFSSSGKGYRLKELLVKNRRQRVAVVVPKKYYKEIIESLYGRSIIYPGELTVSTANMFDTEKTYDVIITLGNYDGRRFNPFLSRSASRIIVLLYEPETTIFRVMKCEYARNTKAMNLKSFLPVEMDDEIESSVAYKDAYQEGPFEDFDEEMERLMDDAVLRGFTGTRLNSQGEGSRTSDVSTVAKFDTGEVAFLTDHYEAYVIGDGSNEVMEKKINDLVPGDEVIFIKNEEKTHDIVDFVLNEIINSGKISDKTRECYSKSRKWKENLREYMKKHQCTPGDVASRLKDSGIEVQENTIKIWIDEDSHTVGPRKEDSILRIAYLTEDQEMLENGKAYMEACSVIRRIRRRILKEIGEFIIGSFGKNERMKENSIIPEDMRDEIKSISECLKIERMINLPEPKTVPSYLTNRPIDLRENI